MKRFHSEIEGIAPILFNQMTDEVKESIGQGKTGGRSSVEVRRKLAEKKAYRNKEGLYCPAGSIKRAMILASSKASLKYGKKALGPFLEALVFIEPMEIPFHEKKHHFIDERVGRIPPRTGGRQIIYRPGLNTGWKLAFTVVLVDDRIPADHVKSALQEAGILQGLCDGRPEFGRFKVTEWTEE
jgi:hypothetical protein